MKSLKFILLVLLFTSVGFISGCNDDTEEATSQFVGNYTITHAATAEPITITTNEIGPFQIQANTDITLQIQAALLSSASCTSSDKAWVELRKDNSMYMSCEGANPFNAGTWAEMDATTLLLNMNSTAIPTSAGGFALTVSGIVQSSAGLKGKTSVPLPKEMIALMIAPLTLAPSNPAITMVVFNIDFTKK